MNESNPAETSVEAKQTEPTTPTAQDVAPVPIEKLRADARIAALRAPPQPLGGLFPFTLTLPRKKPQ